MANADEVDENPFSFKKFIQKQKKDDEFDLTLDQSSSKYQNVGDEISGDEGCNLYFHFIFNVKLFGDRRDDTV